MSEAIKSVLHPEDVKDTSAGRLISAVKDADGNLIGLRQDAEAKRRPPGRS
jgi:hypothetical protein